MKHTVNKEYIVNYKIYDLNDNCVGDLSYTFNTRFKAHRYMMSLYKSVLSVYDGFSEIIIHYSNKVKAEIISKNKKHIFKIIEQIKN